MSTQKPLALRLAEFHWLPTVWHPETSMELTRLYEQNQELLAALKLALPSINPKAVDRKRVQNYPIDECYINTIVRKAIEKAEGTV